MNVDPKIKPKSARQRGFTLMELLVVLVILGMLAALVAPRVLKYLGGAKSDTARVQIERLTAAIDFYRLETGAYPSEAEGLSILVDRPAGNASWDGPYLAKGELPVDPWGNAYRYRVPGASGRDFDIFSLGADNAPGGEGENADIVN